MLIPETEFFQIYFFLQRDPDKEIVSKVVEKIEEMDEVEAVGVMKLDDMIIYKPIGDEYEKITFESYVVTIKLDRPYGDSMREKLCSILEGYEINTNSHTYDQFAISGIVLYPQIISPRAEQSLRRRMLAKVFD